MAVLPDTGEAGARVAAERTRCAVSGMRIETAGWEPFTVTLTVGGAILEGAESAEQALARADKALYQGKADGRNRVVVAHPAC